VETEARFPVGGVHQFLKAPLASAPSLQPVLDVESLGLGAIAKRRELLGELAAVEFNLTGVVPDDAQLRLVNVSGRFVDFVADAFLHKPGSLRGAGSRSAGHAAGYWMKGCTDSVAARLGAEREPAALGLLKTGLFALGFDLSL
jgi:hypothetical protein